MFWKKKTLQMYGNNGRTCVLPENEIKVKEKFINYRKQQSFLLLSRIYLSGSKLYSCILERPCDMTISIQHQTKAVLKVALQSTMMLTHCYELSFFCMHEAYPISLVKFAI